MDFIDTHLHLIYRETTGLCLDGWNSPHWQRAISLSPTMPALTAGHGVAGALFMEAGVDDADYQAEARLCRQDCVGRKWPAGSDCVMSPRRQTQALTIG
ncbi:MAG: hypothetical protein V9G14_14440 [Cypionkella sp.]